MGGQSHAPAGLLPRKQTQPVSIAQEEVWPGVETEISLAHNGIRTANRPAPVVEQSNVTHVHKDPSPSDILCTQHCVCWHTTLTCVHEDSLHKTCHCVTQRVPSSIPLFTFYRFITSLPLYSLSATRCEIVKTTSTSSLV